MAATNNQILAQSLGIIDTCKQIKSVHVIAAQMKSNNEVKTIPWATLTVATNPTIFNEDGLTIKGTENTPSELKQALDAIDALEVFWAANVAKVERVIPPIV